MAQYYVLPFLLFGMFLQFSCTPQEDKLKITKISIEHATTVSSSSRLSVNQEGKAFISWIEHLENDSFQLRFAHLKEDKWVAGAPVASGINWFVNWADFPSLYSFGNGSLASHWLQMRSEGTYEYDIHVSLSSDGVEWSPSFIPHRDSLAAEHGFVSMLPIENDKMMLTWLDGRRTVMAESSYGDHHHAHHGSMTLRTATTDSNGRLSGEQELDSRICDCCQTDMAMSEEGPVIVYRDRSMEEIRDISIVRNIDGIWTEPKSVYNDMWKINACPVNGPAISAKDSTVIVSWFTGAQGQPKVQMALSNDNGLNFALPIRVDLGTPFGRVDCEWITNEIAVITWLEDIKDEAWICSRLIHRDGTISEAQQLIKTDSGRRSGFPTIINQSDGFLISWTYIEGQSSQIKTARISMI